MRTWVFLAIGLLALMGLRPRTAMAAGADETAMPQVGQKAPDVQLPGTDGKAHWLRSYRGKKAVVLAFYPKANTAG